MSSLENPVSSIKSQASNIQHPVFAALYCREELTDDTVFCLTPWVMQWSEDIWLFDITPCKTFWHMQAGKTNKNIYELFSEVLEEYFGTDYLCVLACHPWQCLIFLDYLGGINARGVYLLSENENRQRYEVIPWEPWFNSLSVLSRHCVHLKMKGFDESLLRSKQGQLRRFVERMNLAGPFALKQAENAAIKRRFSGWMGQVWTWTFKGIFTEDIANCNSLSLIDQKISLDQFPWIPFNANHHPSVQRLLEYPVNQWDVIEPLLVDDFTKLCGLGEWSNREYVNVIQWDVMLYSLRSLTIDISFRNPYSLHRDAPEFTTVLYQAYYAYVDLMESLKARDDDLDLPEDIPLISWSVVIKDRLFLPDNIMELICVKENDIDIERILTLQNKLPHHLEAYTLKPDFCPELSFQDEIIGHVAEPGFSIEQWREAAFTRPLFFYKHPVPFTCSAGSHRIFLERTSQNWWQSDDLMAAIRDYYVVEEDGKLIWAFRDHSGSWYKHGVYS